MPTIKGPIVIEAGKPIPKAIQEVVSVPFGLKPSKSKAKGSTKAETKPAKESKKTAKSSKKGKKEVKKDGSGSS